MKREKQNAIGHQLGLFHDGINGRYDDWREKGSNLSGGQAAFFKAVAQRDRLQYEVPGLGTSQGPPSAMDPGQRGSKREALKKLRNGLSDLATLKDLTAPRAHEKGFRPWFTESNARDILVLSDLCAVVEYSAGLFGREYADAVLQKLNEFYGREGEEVIVQRSLRGSGIGVR